MCANTTPFSIRELHICGFLYPQGPGTDPPWTQKDDCNNRISKSAEEKLLLSRSKEVQLNGKKNCKVAQNPL